jgi:hypothetical protein
VVGRQDPTEEMLRIEPPSPSAHARADQDAQPERAAGVDGVDLVVQVLSHCGEVGVGRRHAGVVHQDVAAPEVVVHGVDQPVALLPAAHVTGQRQDVSSRRRRDLAGRGLAILELPAGDHDVGAGGREPLGHRPADAPAAARDQGHLAAQADGIFGGVRHGSGPLSDAHASVDKWLDCCFTTTVLSVGGSPALWQSALMMAP